MMEPGIVVLDASVLGFLLTPDATDAIRRRLRVAHLRVWPSKVNVLEILKDGNTDRAARLLSHLAAWQDDAPLLPWPNALLHAEGLRVLRGEDGVVLADDLAERLVPNASALLDDRERVLRLMTPMHEVFESAHRDNGPIIRRATKERALSDIDARTFLDEVWGNPDNGDHQAQLIWGAVGLPDSAPADLLVQSETWRLLIDALGASVYFRAVRREAQARPAGYFDLLQLIHLAGHQRARILVTNDKAQRETARAVLTGRYPNARVLSGEEFFGA